MSDNLIKNKVIEYYMRYIMSLNESPLLTKCVTAALLNLFEEFAAQSLTFKNGYNYVWSKMLKV